MTQPESALSGKILRALRADGVFCFKVHGNQHMMAGLPDIVACVDGLFLGLETKMPGKRDNTSARQDLIHTAISQAGGRVTVVTSVNEAMRVVAKLRQAAERAR
jgi:hypothetical protein